MPGRQPHTPERQRRTPLAFALLVTAGLYAVTVGVALAFSTNFSEFGSSPEAAGPGPLSVAVADLDGDTDQDLAVANTDTGFPGGVTILLNNGKGNFKERASSPENAALPVAITAADLDGDTDQDLAAAGTGHRVTILLNNGSGNFSRAPSSPEPAGEQPLSVAAADLDGDTDQDLAVANSQSDSVTILLNNGSADFTEPLSSPEFVFDHPTSVVAANLDADTDHDLAVANGGGQSVTILLNDGLADFTQPPSSPEPAGQLPRSVVAADLDGDTDQDLAVANETSDNASVLLNDGFGGFDQAPTSPEAAGDRPRGLTAADFDGDADQDLAFVNLDTATATILRNQGAANFREARSSPEPTGSGPKSVASADFDGDLDLDLVTANDLNLTILRNKGSNPP